MKIRAKFTLFISLAAFFSVIFFSAYLYTELREEMYDLIDYELADGADALFAQLTKTETHTPLPHLTPPGFPMNNYWLRVFTESGDTLYASEMAKISSVAPAPTHAPYFATLAISQNFLSIPKSEKEELKGHPVKLRVRTFRQRIGETTFIVQIGKPILLLNAELQEILVDMEITVPMTIVLIFIAAYLLAGRMLEPLTEINRRIVRIRENSLHERIPLGKSKDELHALSSSLNSMFDRLENSFLRQREFIGNAAHEMKSPLTILMLGHEEMLAANPDPEIRSSLEKQLHSMRRLNKLIRDLLSIARLEQEDTLVRTAVDIPELLNRLLEDYTEITKSGGITVTTSFDPLTISADQEKIQRLFINLIDNGIKYNLNQNGTLHLSTRKERDMAVIEISNSGKIIPPDELKHIFKQFYRVEKSRSQAFGGTGLGLTIASRIVEMHRGSIEVKSGTGTTTFIVMLPHETLV
ncbi:sensor histidine kinase [Desulfopila aestuarii]|uniref:histidine kinase n=1 Tax=Desulfopila aestuarii DSM 18488 TaxID=1121416 RepID=A0A1M7YKV4_9BACT|nr:ATP-binding protein [Desulfopila aestuarii]SHO53260.1 Signal transduction histidine kinase [Desulfopila aestuarii DSM 18488]